MKALLIEENSMRKPTRFSHPIYSLLPKEIEDFDALAELALNLRWSWNHADDEVRQQLDPARWELTHNPWVVLRTVSRGRIEGLSADPIFRKHVDLQIAVKPISQMHCQPSNKANKRETQRKKGLLLC